MRQHVAIAFAAFLSSSILSGCATSLDPARDTTTTGSVEPTMPDGAAQFIGEAASRMDEQSRNNYLAAQMTALNGGKKETFESESMGVNGSVEVGPSSLKALYPDMECRRYSTVVWVVGQGQMVEGDACRGANGPWQVMGFHEP
jgi:surface antigen